MNTMRIIRKRTTITLPRYIVAQMLVTIAVLRRNLVAGWNQVLLWQSGGVARTRQFASQHRHDGDSGQHNDTLLPNGDFHLCPRLYLGEEPKTHRLSITSLAESFQAMLNEQESTQSPSRRLGPQSRIMLSEDQSHYLTSVMRIFKKKNQPFIRLFDGYSGEWLARVSDPQLETISTSEKRHKKARKCLEAECLSLLRTQESSSHAMVPWLCTAVPSSKDRWRWLLEKATELSVGAILLLETEHSSLHKVPSLDKAASYVIEASEQSERLTLPSFVQISDEGVEHPFTGVKDLLQSATMSNSPLKLIICRERTESTVSLWQSLTDVYEMAAPLDPSQPRSAIAFCIGPEGGWSPGEEVMMDELQAKFPTTVYNVSLGPTILRMETAAMTALAGYALFIDEHSRFAIRDPP